MKKNILSLVFILGMTISSFAHYLWIETHREGQVNQAQEIRVYYGEYTYGVIEGVEGEAFPKVKNFDLWVIDSKGKKQILSTTAQEQYYVAYFTPSENGVYTVVLDNHDIEVIDYTKYDFGIFKTHYHSTAKISVGQSDNETTSINPNGLTINEVPAKEENDLTLQVTYQGDILAKHEVKIYIEDLWSKTLYTDDQGLVSLKLPWNTKYTVETTIKEEVPGTFKGKDYQFIWHCATYCVTK